jgi:hypothetical protein
MSTVSARLSPVSVDTGTLSTLLSARTVVGYDEGSALGGGHIQSINFTGTAITASQSGSTLTVDVTASGGGGGGASSLALGQGSLQAFVQKSSPTSHISFATGPFIVTLISPTTAFIGIDYSSFTMQGQISASGGGGSDNLGSHLSTRTTVLPFGVTASSGVVVSSLNVMGVITSSSAVIASSGNFRNVSISFDGTNSSPTLSFTSSQHPDGGVGIRSDGGSLKTLDFMTNGRTAMAISDFNSRVVTISSPYTLQITSGSRTENAIHGLVNSSNGIYFDNNAGQSSQVIPVIVTNSMDRIRVGYDGRLVVGSTSTSHLVVNASSMSVNSSTVCFNAICGQWSSTQTPSSLTPGDYVLHYNNLNGGPTFYLGGDQAGAGGAGITEDQANALIISTWNAANQLASTQTITGSKTFTSSATFQTIASSVVYVSSLNVTNLIPGTSSFPSLGAGQTVTPNMLRANTFILTLGSNITINGPLNPSPWQRVTFVLVQDGTGGRSATWATGANNFSFGTDIGSVVLSPTANATDYVAAIWNPTASRWNIVSQGRGY